MLLKTSKCFVLYYKKVTHQFVSKFKYLLCVVLNNSRQIYKELCTLYVSDLKNIDFIMIVMQKQFKEYFKNLYVKIQLSFMQIQMLVAVNNDGPFEYLVSVSDSPTCQIVCPGRSDKLDTAQSRLHMSRRFHLYG